MKNETSIEIENNQSGHESLLIDVEALFSDVERFTFHDFKSDEALPKIYLRERLLTMAQAVVDGRYDNSI